MIQLIAIALALPFCISASLLAPHFGYLLVAFVFLALSALTFLIYLFLLASSIITMHWRRLTASIFGLVFGVLSVFAAPIIKDAMEDLSFHFNRGRYDEVVRRERVQHEVSKPVRMIVEYEDRSLFVTANSFHYIVYDETDEALRQPDNVDGFWRYVETDTGILSIDGRKTVRHISDHYYSIWTSY